MTVGVRSDVPLPLYVHAAMFATGFINDALRNTVPSVNEPRLQLINAVFRFLCNAVQDIQDYASLIFLGHIIYATVCQYICPSVSTSVHLSYL